MMGIILGGLVAALAVGAVAVVIRDRIRHKRRQRRYRENYRRDQAAINGNRCASCGGLATELMADLETDQVICKDRATCRQVMIYRSMLDSMA